MFKSLNNKHKNEKGTDETEQRSIVIFFVCFKREVGGKHDKEDQDVSRWMASDKGQCAHFPTATC
jgi:hypothetical protein